MTDPLDKVVKDYLTINEPTATKKWTFGAASAGVASVPIHLASQSEDEPTHSRVVIELISTIPILGGPVLDAACPQVLQWDTVIAIDVVMTSDIAESAIIGRQIATVIRGMALAKWSDEDAKTASSVDYPDIISAVPQSVTFENLVLAQTTYGGVAFFLFSTTKDPDADIAP